MAAEAVLEPEDEGGETLPLFSEGELPVALRPPSYFRRVPRRLPVEFCCPKCGYGWAGSPIPNPAEAASELDAEP